MKNRIVFLDVIRGLSIIGILFINISSFSWPENYDSFPSLYWNTSNEKWLHSLQFIFAQSSFYPLFSILFGISMGFIINRAIQSQLNPYLIFIRRLLFLLILGICHAFLIWHGDILTIYAVLGFFLLPFYRINVQKLLITAASIWLIPNILYAAFLYLNGAYLDTFNNYSVIKEVINQYQSGLLSALHQNVLDWLHQYDIQSIPFIVISIFPMFLFGLALAKSGYLNKLNDKSSFPHAIWILSGLIGGILKTLPIIKPDYLFYMHLAEAFGGPLIGVFYGLTIIKWGNKAINKWVAPLGKLSMSNYLFQSFIGFILFKVLGLYGVTTPFINFFIAIIVIILQIGLSNYWLQTHQYGPIEKIWRNFTYYPQGNKSFFHFFNKV
jgi:uncharacterized protein